MQLSYSFDVVHVKKKVLWASTFENVLGDDISNVFLKKLARECLSNMLASLSGV